MKSDAQARPLMPLYHSCAGRSGMTAATTLCIAMVWVSWRLNQSHQDTLHFCNAHVHVLNHSPVEHPRRHIPPPALLLQGMETLQDDTFPMGETVANIGEVVTRVTGRAET